MKVNPPEEKEEERKKKKRRARPEEKEEEKKKEKEKKKNKEMGLDPLTKVKAQFNWALLYTGPFNCTWPMPAYLVQLIWTPTASPIRFGPPFNPKPN